MPAYTVDLQRSCQSCSKPATHEVRNSVNAPMGRFCKRHADELVAEMNGTDR